jgi:hypothetical protein
MTITDHTIPFCIDAHTVRVAEEYAKTSGMSNTEALRFFMSTRTYELLINPESYLYLESMEYILDMLDAELTEDWDRWLEI